MKLGRRPEGLVSFRFVRIARLFGIAAVYVVACRVMLAPICNFSALSSATYEGDVRLVVWALAWDNHAVIAGLPLFSANIFYPTPASLAYGEHFIGIGLFSLPVFLLTHNPVLAYNVVWLLSYLLSAGGRPLPDVEADERSSRGARVGSDLRVLLLSDAPRSRSSAPALGILDTHLDDRDGAMDCHALVAAARGCL